MVVVHSMHGALIYLNISVR